MRLRSLATTLVAVVMLVPHVAHASQTTTLRAPFSDDFAWTICDARGDLFVLIPIGVCRPYAQTQKNSGIIDLAGTVSGTRTASAHGLVASEFPIAEDTTHATLTAHVRLEELARLPQDVITVTFGSDDPACGCGDYRSVTINTTSLQSPRPLTITFDLNTAAGFPMPAGSSMRLEVDADLDARGAESLQEHTTHFRLVVDSFEVTLA